MKAFNIYIMELSGYLSQQCFACWHEYKVCNGFGGGDLEIKNKLKSLAGWLAGCS